MNRTKHACFYFTCCDLIIKGQKLPKCYFQRQFLMSSYDFHLRKFDQRIRKLQFLTLYFLKMGLMFVDSQASQPKSNQKINLCSNTEDDRFFVLPNSLENCLCNMATQRNFQYWKKGIVTIVLCLTNLQVGPVTLKLCMFMYVRGAGMTFFQGSPMFLSFLYDHF